MRLLFFTKMLPLLTIPMLLSGCASVFNGRTQDVKVETQKENATVYVDNQKEGKGSSVKLNLRRNLEIRQLRVEADGYLPRYKAVYQSKTSFPYILSFFPFGPLSFWLATFSDMTSPKRLNFKDQYVIDKMASFPEWNKDQKYLRADRVIFNLKPEDIVYKQFDDYDDFTHNEDPNEQSNPDDGMKGRVTFIPGRLNEKLDKYNYIDTTEVFRDKLNTLEFDLRFDSLGLKYIEPIGFGSLTFGTSDDRLIQGYADIAFQLTNIYGEQLYEDSMLIESGEFVAKDQGENNFRRVEKQMAAKAMVQFLKQPEVQQTMRREKGKDQNFKPLAIRPGKAIDTLQEAQKATVTVAIGDKGHGSGCVVGRNGYIVTNYHVVANHEDELTVTQGQQEAKLEAEVIRKNAYADLALIKVDKQFAYTYRIPEQKTFETGMTAYTIGTPESRALRQSFTKGIISGKRAQQANTYLQTDASVNPGNSGGALVDQKGRLHGIVTSKLMGVAYEGVSFSLSADLVDDRLGLQYQEGSAAASQQKPQKGSQQPSR